MGPKNQQQMYKQRKAQSKKLDTLPWSFKIIRREEIFFGRTPQISKSFSLYDGVLQKLLEGMGFQLSVSAVNLKNVSCNSQSIQTLRIPV